MSYYESPQSQWSSAPSHPNWEHQGATTPVRAGASGPQSQDDFAFSYQFDEVDRAYENLQKSGKGFGMGGRPRPSHGNHRSHSVNHFDDARGPRGGPELHNFYASQRHQSSRGSNEAEQVMQAKRRMAAQRERELRNLHTEQQYQRNSAPDMTVQSNKHMSEEETRDLIARQRNALYGEASYSDKSGYMDEAGNMRPNLPGTSGPSSLRGHSPLTFDTLGRGPPSTEAGTPGAMTDPSAVPVEPNPRPRSTASPQSGGPTNKALDNAVGPQSRTTTSSPTGGSPPRDLAPGSKAGQTNATVAPIGTRPSGTPTGTASNKRSTTPHGTQGGWGRGSSGGVWGQSSGLGTQASVWG